MNPQTDLPASSGSNGLRVAVTGGSGQLGTLLLRHLLAEESIGEVISLDLRPPLVAGSPRLRAVQADIRSTGLEAHLSGCDALFHLAFVVTQHLPRAEVESINLGGTRNVLDAAARAGVRHVLYSSSVAAYGVLPGHPVPIVEETPRRYHPDFAYSATKYEVEAFLDEFERKHPEILVTRMRPVILVGKRMDHPLGESLRRRRILDLGGGSPLPIVWDEDVADAFMLSYKQRKRGAYNLSADELLSAEELALQAGLRRIFVPREFALRAIAVQNRLAALGLGGKTDPAWIESAGATMVPTSQKAKEVLGWHPRYPSAVSVIRHFKGVVPMRLDRRLALLLRLLSKTLGAEDLAGAPEGAVHLNLLGTAGGDLCLSNKNGRLALGFRPPRPPTTALFLHVDLFWQLLRRNDEDLLAYETRGDLTIEGDREGLKLVEAVLSAARKNNASRMLMHLL